MSKPGIPFVSALWKSLASFFQYNIGLMCERGGGGSEDPARAAEWYGKACKNGLQQGCEKLRELTRYKA